MIRADLLLGRPSGYDLMSRLKERIGNETFRLKRALAAAAFLAELKKIELAGWVPRSGVKRDNALLALAGLTLAGCAPIAAVSEAPAQTGDILTTAVGTPTPDAWQILADPLNRVVKLSETEEFAEEITPKDSFYRVICIN